MARQRDKASVAIALDPTTEDPEQTAAMTFAGALVPAQRRLGGPHRLQRHRRAPDHLAADAGQPVAPVRPRWPEFDHLRLIVQSHGTVGAPAGPNRAQNANDAGDGLTRVVASDPFEGPVNSGSLLLSAPLPVEAGGAH
jgi:hypothetical protein